jgi:Fe-S-cluster-containing dehydrogenase component
MKAFVFDSALCNGCRNCQIVCKDEHVGNDWSPYAKPQPDSGQFWLKVDESVRGSVPKVMMSYTVRFCQHCEQAACAAACDQDAFIFRDDGLVLVNYEKCNGCANCVAACPYHAIFFNEEIQAVQKCTGCAHLLDDGWTTPRCVDACPHEALRFGELDDFTDELSDSMPLIKNIPGSNTPGSNTPGPNTLGSNAPGSPRVFYLNLPKRFIAGVVVDLEADEVIIGAKITLENLNSGVVIATTTDEFGDFWFKQIEAAPYRLYFEADGFAIRTLEVSTEEKDINVGEVDLFIVSNI